MKDFEPMRRLSKYSEKKKDIWFYHENIEFISVFEMKSSYKRWRQSHAINVLIYFDLLTVNQMIEESKLQ